jgi:hypothetical protein
MRMQPSNIAIGPRSFYSVDALISPTWAAQATPGTYSGQVVWSYDTTNGPQTLTQTVNLVLLPPSVFVETQTLEQVSAVLWVIVVLLALAVFVAFGLMLSSRKKYVKLSRLTRAPSRDMMGGALE